MALQPCQKPIKYMNTNYEFNFEKKAEISFLSTNKTIYDFSLCFLVKYLKCILVEDTFPNA